jgi:hypothetical protein
MHINEEGRRKTGETEEGIAIRQGTEKRRCQVGRQSDDGGGGGEHQGEGKRKGKGQTERRGKHGRGNSHLSEFSFEIIKNGSFIV